MGGNLIRTEIDQGNVILENARFQDDIIVAAAGNFLSGTILARNSVSNKLIAYVKGGVTQNDGIPRAILTYDVDASGGSDVPVRVGIAGEYRKERLIIFADGDDSNVDDVVKDLLRETSLIPQNVDDVSVLDNG